MKILKLILIAIVFLFLSDIIFAQKDQDSIINYPTISSVSLEHDTIGLDDFKGDLVLVYFWASWNKPSRKINAELREVYTKYHKKGYVDAKSFEIYSISLDIHRENWLNASTNDRLNWHANMSSFDSWENNAIEIFDVDLIPMLILLDQKGQIIWSSHSVNNLEMELRKHLEK